MAKPFLGVRIPEELNRALLSHIRETGQTKSDIVIAALQAYLGLLPCHRRLEAIEQRLSDVETTIGYGQSCALPEDTVVNPASGHH